MEKKTMSLRSHISGTTSTSTPVSLDISRPVSVPGGIFETTDKSISKDTKVDLINSVPCCIPQYIYTATGTSVFTTASNSVTTSTSIPENKEATINLVTSADMSFSGTSVSATAGASVSGDISASTGTTISISESPETRDSNSVPCLVSDEEGVVFQCFPIFEKEMVILSVNDNEKLSSSFVHDTMTTQIVNDDTVVMNKSTCTTVSHKLEKEIDQPSEYLGQSLGDGLQSQRTLRSRKRKFKNIVGEEVNGHRVKVLKVEAGDKTVKIEDKKINKSKIEIGDKEMGPDRIEASDQKIEALDKKVQVLDKKTVTIKVDDKKINSYKKVKMIEAICKKIDADKTDKRIEGVDKQIELPDRINVKTEKNKDIDKSITTRYKKIKPPPQNLVTQSLMEKPQSFRCGLCNIYLPTAQDLATHKADHNQRMSCIKCDKSFLSLKQLKRHMTVHTSTSQDPQHQCVQCGRVCGSESALSRHKNTHKRTQGRHQCHLCEQRIRTRHHLKEHLARKHKINIDKKFECPMCDRHFASKTHLEIHLVSHGEGTGKVTKLCCGECGRVFVRPHSFQQHLRSHRRTYTCPTCKKNFTTARELTVHSRTHHPVNTNKLSCPKCTLSFAFASQLTRHMRVHTGERPYQCETCGKAFKRLQQCHAHQRMIHGSQRDACVECGKTFGDKTNLLRHRLMVHYHLKRWLCGVCGQSYAYSQDLRNHLAKQHSLKFNRVSAQTRKSRYEVHVIPELTSESLNPVVEAARELEKAKVERVMNNTQRNHATSSTTTVPQNCTVLPSTNYHNTVTTIQSHTVPVLASTQTIRPLPTTTATTITIQPHNHTVLATTHALRPTLTTIQPQNHTVLATTPALRNNHATFTIQPHNHTVVASRNPNITTILPQNHTVLASIPGFRNHTPAATTTTNLLPHNYHTVSLRPTHNISTSTTIKTIQPSTTNHTTTMPSQQNHTATTTTTTGTTLVPLPTFKMKNERVGESERECVFLESAGGSGLGVGSARESVLVDGTKVSDSLNNLGCMKIGEDAIGSRIDDDLMIESTRGENTVGIGTRVAENTVGIGARVAENTVGCAQCGIEIEPSLAIQCGGCGANLCSPLHLDQHASNHRGIMQYSLCVFPYPGQEGVIAAPLQSLGSVEAPVQSLGSVGTPVQSFGSVGTPVQSLRTVGAPVQSLGSTIQTLGSVGRVVQNIGSMGTVLQNVGSLGKVVQPIGTVVQGMGSLGTVVQPIGALGTVVQPLGTVVQPISTVQPLLVQGEGGTLIPIQVNGQGETIGLGEKLNVNRENLNTSREAEFISRDAVNISEQAGVISREGISGERVDFAQTNLNGGSNVERQFLSIDRQTDIQALDIDKHVDRQNLNTDKHKDSSQEKHIFTVPVTSLLSQNTPIVLKTDTKSNALSPPRSKNYSILPQSISQAVQDSGQEKHVITVPVTDFLSQNIPIVLKTDRKSHSLSAPQEKEIATPQYISQAIQDSNQEEHVITVTDFLSQNASLLKSEKGKEPSIITSENSTEINTEKVASVIQDSVQENHVQISVTDFLSQNSPIVLNSEKEELSVQEHKLQEKEPTELMQEKHVQITVSDFLSQNTPILLKSEKGKDLSVVTSEEFKHQNNMIEVPVLQNSAIILKGRSRLCIKEDEEERKSAHLDATPLHATTLILNAGDLSENDSTSQLSHATTLILNEDDLSREEDTRDTSHATTLLLGDNGGDRSSNGNPSVIVMAPVQHPSAGTSISSPTQGSDENECVNQPVTTSMASVLLTLATPPQPPQHNTSNISSSLSPSIPHTLNLSPTVPTTHLNALPSSIPHSSTSNLAPPPLHPHLPHQNTCTLQGPPSLLVSNVGHPASSSSTTITTSNQHSQVGLQIVDECGLMPSNPPRKVSVEILQPRPRRYKTRQTIYARTNNESPEGDSNTHKCRTCDKSFSTHSYLMRHQRIHTPLRHACTVCGKTFTEKFNLKTHMLTHTQERPHSCTLCNKTFRYVRDLTEHKRTHEGIRPHQCEVCNISFLRRRDYIRHYKEQHSCERYECKVCGASFKRRIYLETVHMRKHHPHATQERSKEPKSTNASNPSDNNENKEVHICRTCGKTFARARYLTSHMRTHSRRADYIRCPRCPRMFTSEHTLKVHRETFHDRDIGSSQDTSCDIDDSIAHPTTTSFIHSYPEPQTDTSNIYISSQCNASNSEV